MREIKFRAMSKRNIPKWVYGWAVGDCIANYATIINWDEIRNTGEEARYEVIPESMGQFTGLHDKNGVEIFEGDICTNPSEYGNRHKAVVWIDGLAKFVFSSILGKSFLASKDYEVIGNIYENPELLENR